MRWRGSATRPWWLGRRCPNAHSGAGSLLTLQEDERFDAVVYGERVPERWMAGSDFFRRTQDEKAQESCRPETLASTELVQVAVVYSGKRITLYRNGVHYASYEVDSPQRFDKYALMLGLRYLGSMGAIGFFAGDIEEARLYDVALAEADIARCASISPLFLLLSAGGPSRMVLPRI